MFPACAILLKMAFPLFPLEYFGETVMKWFTGLAALLLTIGIVGTASAQEAAKEPPPPSIYDFTMKNIDGEDVSLSAYKGKVMLIVNVASRCGYTPQYKGLQELHSQYKDQGLVVLGFPSNDFGKQEPGTNEEIKIFCTTKYAVDFPMFAKITVKGEEKHPLYKFLTEKETNPAFPGEVAWNFNKFLVDRNGKIVGRFGSKDKPEDEKLVKAIQASLAPPEN